MLVHSDILRKDIKKCLKKKWYPGIDVEARRIIKLLKIDGKLPGEYPMKGFSGSAGGAVLHARINLPKASFGKSSGPRLVYVKSDVIKTVYLGGHKDKIYNSPKLIKVVKERLSDNISYYSFEEYMKLTETKVF